MAVVRDVRVPPLAWVGVAAAVAAMLRFAVALGMRSPVYYPDEYRATALARSMAEGGLPRLRGEILNATFTSYVPSLFQAFAWLVEDVDVAYRLAQAIGCATFASAAFPAYLLARWIGVTARGSIMVALLALAVPAGSLTSTLLAEAYAYPAFLWSVILAVRALTYPSPARHAATVTVAAALCLVGGLQFLFFGAAYVAAWLLSGPWSVRAAGRRALIFASGLALAAAVLVFVRDGRFLSVLTQSARGFEYSASTLAWWFVTNAFAFAVAAGWVLVPAAAAGLYALFRSPDARSRAFALMSTVLLLALLAEAAVMSARYGLHERFTFYAAPLFAASFVWAAERVAFRRPAYAAIAYVGAACAILLPTTQWFEGNLDHAPAILGLFEAAFGDDLGPVIWAPLLAALAVGVAWRGAAQPRTVAITALAVCGVLSAGASLALVQRSRAAEPSPRVVAPEGSTLVTWAGGDRNRLQKALFWNREITRVAVVGGESPDRYPVTRARMAASGLVADPTGDAVPGPYVVGQDTVAIVRENPIHENEPLVVLAGAPSVLAFGVERRLGRVGGFAGEVHAFTLRAATLTLIFRSPDSPRRLLLRCKSGLQRSYELGVSPALARVPVAPGSSASCRFLATGGLERVGTSRVGAHFSVSLDAGRTRAATTAR